MKRRARSFLPAVLSGALLAGLLGATTLPAEATSNPTPETSSAPAPADAAPAPAAKAGAVAPGKLRGLAGVTSSDNRVGVKSAPKPARTRPSDGAAASRDLASGAVRPLDGTKVATLGDISSPCAPLGRVRTAGPGDIWLTGTAVCRGGVWTMTVTGGTGTIGGMPIASKAVRGTIVRKASGVTANVTMGLPLQPKVVPAWTQTAKAMLIRRNGPWSGTVTVAQGGGTARLSMTGPLGAGNSYVLKATGSIAWAGTTVPLAGTYWSPVPKTLVKGTATNVPRWSIGGRAPKSGSIPGATVTAPVIRMTQANPGVTGTTTVTVAPTTSATFPGALRYISSSTWVLAALPGSAVPYVPAALPGASIALNRISGAIMSKKGLTKWTLTAPMTLVEARLTVNGYFDIQGPSTWRMRPVSGTGRILDIDASLPFTGEGEVIIRNGVPKGAIGLRTEGELLIDLPEGWTTSTLYTLEPRAGRTITFNHQTSYQVANGPTDFVLIGDVDPNGAPYQLFALGEFDINGTRVPVSGELASVGWVRNGQPLTEPYWTTFADIGSVPGGVPIGSGAVLSDGQFGFEGHGAPDLLPEAAGGAAAGAMASTPLPSPTYQTTSVSGVVEMQPTSSNPFTITSNYTYMNSTNWTVTIAHDSTNKSWTPMSGLTFQESQFSGTVKNNNGSLKWNVLTSTVAWPTVAAGASMSAVPWAMNTECPFPQNTCPVIDYTGVFMYESGALLDFADSTPDTHVTGAFLADGSWSNFYGTTNGTVVYNTMQLTGIAVTLSNGQQRTPPDPNITLPDINGDSINIEVCGDFTITIPVIVPTQARGCAQWSDTGVILAQSTTTGDFTTDPTNNVNIKKGSLTGYAWTNMPHPQNISIDQQPMRIQPGRQYILSAIVIPGRLMHDSGTGTALDSTFFMIGSFTPSEVDISGSFPVGISNGTMTLEAVTVDITLTTQGLKEVGFGVRGGALIQGKEYQIDGDFSAETEEAMISVSLTVKGTRTDDPLGGFEMANLVNGDFEPGATQVLDSSFDSGQGPNMVTDGGFENGSDRSSQIANPGFEDNVGANLVDDPSFENQSGRNLLDNADAEDFELLTNPDFETYLDENNKGTTLGWVIDSQVTSSIGLDSANGDDTTQYSVWLRSSTAGGSYGIHQQTKQTANPGDKVRLSFWARSDGGSGEIMAKFIRVGPCGTTNVLTQTFSLGANDGWKQFTLDYTGASSCNGTTGVLIAPNTANWTFVLDSASLQLVSRGSTSQVVISPPSVNTPSIIGRFDDANSVPHGYKTSGVKWSSDYGGTLASTLANDYFYLDQNYQTGGDFEVSADVIFPAAGSTVDAANLGFAITGTDSKASGVGFTVAGGPSNGQPKYLQGFYVWPGGSRKAYAWDGTFQQTLLATDTWFTVHIVSIDSQVTAWVTRKSDGTVMFRQVADLKSLNYSPDGYIGQLPLSGASTAGHRWDNWSVHDTTNKYRTMFSPTDTHPNDQESNNGVLQVNSPSTSGTFNAQYEVNPGDVSGTYTYSAWAKLGGSGNGTVQASVMLETVDTDNSNREAATGTFTLTRDWQQVSVTLPITKTGHLGIRTGFINVKGSDNYGTLTTLMIDDQKLTDVQWSIYPSTSQAVTLSTTNKARTGTNSMTIVDHNNGSEVKYAIAPPYSHSNYRLSMWVASDSAYTASVTLAGGGSEAKADFTTDAPQSNGTLVWKQVTVDYNPPDTNESIFIDIETGTGNNGKTLYVDDVSVVATLVDDYIPGLAGTIPLPAGWSTTSGSPIVVADQPNAHTGQAFMRLGPNGSSISTSTTYSGTFGAGQVYTLDTWIKTPDGSGGTATVSVAQNTGSCGAGSTATASGVTLQSSWQKVSLSCLISSSSVTSLTVTFTSSSTSKRIDIDDVDLQPQGLNLADAWTVQAGTGSGYGSLAALSNPSTAHSGSVYTQLKGTGDTAIMRIDNTVDLSKGTTQFIDGWFRSGGSSQVNARMKLIGYSKDGSGTLTQQAIKSWDVGAPVGSWVYDFTSVTWPSNVTVVRTQIETTKAGDVVLVDDVSSRQVAQWVKQSSASMDSVVKQVIDASQAAAGAGYLSMHTYGNITTSDTTRSGASATLNETVNKGTTFQAQAYARITPGRSASASIRLGITYGTGSTAETHYQSFPLTSDWQLFTMTATATTDHGYVPTTVFVLSDNRTGSPSPDPVDSWIDVDEVRMTPQSIAADPSWTVYQESGTTLTWINADDRTRAHNSSSGLAELTKSNATARAGLVNYVGGTIPKAGETYTLNAWVRSPTSGVAISGNIELWGDGGTAESQSTSFTAPGDGTWTLVTAQKTFTNSNHTGMHIAVLMSTAGALDVDDVSVTKLDWSTSATGGSVAVQTLIQDAKNAQGGSNYLRLTNNGTGTAATQEKVTKSYPAGTSLNPIVYLRSTSGDDVSVNIEIGPEGGPYSLYPNAGGISTYTITGTNWVEIAPDFSTAASYSNLVMRVIINTPGASLDIDSYSLGDSEADVDGVITPLDHPEWGYEYIWDNAFGIPGLHLWAFTGQVQFNAEGLAGIGMSTTSYLDPTKLPSLMTGTQWIKSQKLVNVSDEDPCLSVKFDATGTDAGLQIQGGALKTKLFYLNFAPNGCQMGEIEIPRGVSVGFSAQLGDGTVTMQLKMGKDSKGNTIYSGEAALANVKIGGTQYQSLDLIVSHTATEDDLYFNADVIFPFGRFFGRIDMEANAEGALMLDGQVHLKDWTLVGGGFDVQSLDIDILDVIPEGSPCGFIHDEASGQMSMAKKSSLQFEAEIQTSCGVLEILTIEYDYSHGGITQTFELDFNASTGHLSGGVSYAFNRSFSWKFLTHRYHRHPKVYVGITFDMDIYNPSKAAEAKIDGSISVSGGDGSLSCSLSTSGDDYCRLKVDIHGNIGGGRHWEEDW